MKFSVSVIVGLALGLHAVLSRPIPHQGSDLDNMDMDLDMDIDSFNPFASSQFDDSDDNSDDSDSSDESAQPATGHHHGHHHHQQQSNADDASGSGDSDDDDSSSDSGAGSESSYSSPSSSGGGGSASSAGGSDFQSAILDPQNALRAKKGAAPLTWSDSIAASAQSWANNCQFKHSGGQYGENISAGTGNFSPADGVKLWTDEESEYNPSSPQFSHYTQVVWKGSKQIGCAVASCNGMLGSGASNFYVCQYDPAGNVEGEFGSNVEA